jgi:hypothetical protein
MELWKIYHRWSTDYDADVPLRDPSQYPGDVAAIGNGRLMIVRDGKWVNATRGGFDATLIRFKCIKR